MIDVLERLERVISARLEANQIKEDIYREEAQSLSGDPEKMAKFVRLADMAEGQQTEDAILLKIINRVGAK